MNGQRWAAAALGVTALVALGMFTTGRAEPHVDGATPQTSGKGALRENVAALRSEVELLEMEHEVARQALIKTFKGRADRSREHEAELTRMLVDARTALADRRTKSTNEEWNKVVDDSAKTFHKNGIDRRHGEDDVDMLVRWAAETEYREFDRKEATGFGNAIEREKASFLQRARTLNGKRLELAGCEAEYKATK